VVDGVQDAGTEPGGGERAVRGDGQRLLGDPALAEHADHVGSQRPALRGADRGAQCLGRLLPAIGPAEPADRRLDRAGQVQAAGQFADHQRERAGGQVAAGVAVGERRGLAADGERVVAGQPDRRDAHDAAAALAVVGRDGGRARPRGLDRGEADIAGTALLPQEVLTDQPAAGAAVFAAVARRLGGQPALVRPPDRGGCVPAAGWP